MEHREQEKLARIINLLIEFSKGNFEAKEEISDEDDPLNTVISGLHMLAEELSYSKKIQKQNELIKEKLIGELSNRYNEMMQFNYIVSHNLRTPVVQILGLAQLLDNSDSDEERAVMNKYMVNAAVAMDEMLKDLNVILSTKSSLHEKKESFSITSVIEAAKAQLGNQINKNKANIILNIDKDADEVFTVKGYIQSVVFNLLSNAIKYKAIDKSPIINIIVEKRANFTHMIVSDNGIGIDLNIYKDRIFKLYSRGSHAQEGKGLGLYMIKTQLESLGGSIVVDSCLDKGTTFTVTF